MTDEIMTEDFDPRLELITDFLAGALPPEAVEEVKRRLETDADFREYCAPILLAWSVPPKHEREPMSRAELAKHWDTFTKRAGFVHQRKRARKRRLWFLGAALLTIGITAYALRTPVREWYRDRTEYHAVPFSSGWIPLGSGRGIKLEPGATLRVANEVTDDVVKLKLIGAARVRTHDKETSALTASINSVAVETRSGTVFVGAGELNVTARGDTTVVTALRPEHRVYIGFMPMPAMAIINSNGRGADLRLNEGQTARVVRGQSPTLIQ